MKEGIVMKMREFDRKEKESLEEQGYEAENVDKYNEENENVVEEIIGMGNGDRLQVSTSGDNEEDDKITKDEKKSALALKVLSSNFD